MLQDFQLWFHIPFQEARAPHMAGNLYCFQGMEVIVWAKIGKEIREGKVWGPFSPPPLPSLRVSPLGFVPKKTSGECRLIHHFSYPPGGAPEKVTSGWLTSWKVSARNWGILRTGQF